MKADKKEFQRMYKVYLKALLKEKDLEKHDYLQHQLRVLGSLIKNAKEDSRLERPNKKGDLSNLHIMRGKDYER